MKVIVVDGSKIKDIKSFYEEINSVFMQNEDWKLGESLDAFNDMIYGGFGEINGKEEIRLIWKNFEKSKVALGLDPTLAFYENKIKSPEIYNIDFILGKISDLKAGKGQTYFDIILEIIADHSNIELVEA